MTTLVLVWDNAGWHGTHQVRDWLRQHNQTVARSGQGVRLAPCWLPSRSPWLNPLEPRGERANDGSSNPPACSVPTRSRSGSVRSLPVRAIRSCPYPRMSPE
ncbi:MAG: transposase [Vicinamibacterales bacterium]